MNFYVEKAFKKEQDEREESEQVINEFRRQNKETQNKTYLKFDGVIGEVYQANRDEFEPKHMSRVEEVENLNRILDKLHEYLLTVP